jgi:DNA polymerase elongation subunit (family B)
MPKLRTITLDIEKAPDLVYTWGRFKQFISQSQVVQEGYILSYSIKVLDEDDKYALGLDTFLEVERPTYEEMLVAEKSLLALLKKELNDADVIIAHNGDKFDIPYINSRFAYHKMSPPSFSTQIDTLKFARKAFKFPSNALASLCSYLQLPLKTDSGGMETFIQCMRGSRKAFKTILEYNLNDSVITEKLYHRIAPFVRAHPNMGHGEFKCPKCGSSDLQRRGVTPPTAAGVSYPRYSCSSCGKWSQGKQAVGSVEERRGVLKG